MLRTFRASCGQRTIATSFGTDSLLYPGPLTRLGASFFLFGLINNVLYVIILSAALDLVPQSTPKGIIAFWNIAPALVAKVGWPYLLKGEVRYAKRIVGCCALSFVGMLMVGFSTSLGARLVGIGLASFSSGLGELTFLQLSTTFSPPSVGGHAVGYFASGTGGAGLVGAFIWWEVRGFGVKAGIGMSSILPFINPITYYCLLPLASAFVDASTGPSSAYQPLNAAADDEDEVAVDDPEHNPLLMTSGYVPPTTTTGINSDENGLTLKEKWALSKPLLLKYMLPLFCVYTFEYIINQGIAPTLVYEVPSPDKYPVISKIIHSIRDYYPFWQLTYQSFVFLSRSSITLGLPPLPRPLLSLPAFVQAIILVVLALESALGIFEGGTNEEMGMSFWMIVVLIGVEGICGGLAYVNVFYRVNQEPLRPDASPIRAQQEQEFKIGSIGFADSSGILVASLLAMPVEVGLCGVQVGRGKELCRTL
ncbi:batten's disease protein Cln3 [Pterulicium gracile]|uniref:Protein BTN n=1 Tax=Pterulicium gracile TaxID=1884261 RepID=A0A5C3Q554_9AGAR|nr:batten's disease protein Cln3 [Pterula gracilis]